jgi:dihydropyrimidine dehydrogenase (NADP+)
MVCRIRVFIFIKKINISHITLKKIPLRYSTPGGYSARAVHPIVLGKVMQIARMIKEEFNKGQSLSGIGGVETGNDAAEFLVLGANTVQINP